LAVLGDEADERDGRGAHLAGEQHDIVETRLGPGVEDRQGVERGYALGVRRAALGVRSGHAGHYGEGVVVSAPGKAGAAAVVGDAPLCPASAPGAEACGASPVAGRRASVRERGPHPRGVASPATRRPGRRPHRTRPLESRADPRR
jgi:hypothetical protein